MKIYLGFFLLFFVLVVGDGYYFLTNLYNDERFYCVTNTTNALSWVIDEIEEKLNFKSSYIPESPKNVPSFNLDIENDSKSKQYIESPWTIQNSLNFHFGPIFDERWEDLPTFKSNFVPSNDKRTELEFTQVAKVSSENFEIPVSIRIEEQGHIFLCDGQNVNTSRCYWLLLQGFEKKASAIRKCEKNDIPIKNGVYPKSPCRDRRFEIEHPQFPYFLTNTQWRHFLLTKKQNTIAFIQISHSQKTTILEWKDEGNPINVTDILIHSKTVNGLWKFHNYFFFYTNQESEEVKLDSLIYSYKNSICISMYISMCSSCKIKLSLSYQKTIVKEERFESQRLGWMKIQFVVENINQYYGHVLLISTVGQNSDRFWAIDKIRQCKAEEYRYIGLTAKAKCQLISEREEITEILDNTEAVGNSCPENTIGDFCMKCDMIYGSNCNRVTICNGNKCFCSAGFYGSNCYNSCADGTYGHGCMTKCGKCSYNQCHFINGVCSYNSCVENYSGPKCDIPSAIIFTNPPDVVQIGFTEAKIVVANFGIERGMSSESPQSYTIQYKRADQSRPNWITSNQTENFNQRAEFKLKTLEPETDYLVRGVIITTTWQLGDHLKTRKFSTNCKEISENNIQIQATNTTAFVSITQDSEFTCKLYEISIFQAASSFSNNSGTFFKGLTPYTQYTVKVSGKINIDKTFKTSAGVPSQVLNFKKLSSSSTSIHLQWTKPAEINGFFEHYVVEYQHISYKDCNNIRSKLSEKKQLTTTDTSIKIDSLLPYSYYQFWIFAKNSKFDGIVNNIIESTNASEHISLEEIPEIQIETSHFGARINFSEINCENKHGTLVAKIKTTCITNWCQDQHRKPRTIDSDVNRNVSISNLISFSEYDIQVTFCRRNGTCSELIHKKFTTKPTVPRKVTNLDVYTKNETSISLRWKPSYPPTGILQDYKITYSYYSWGINYKKEVIFEIIPCKLWPEFHCVTLISLESQQKYTINVLARNKEPNDFGDAATISIKTEKTKPEAPYDLKVDWTLENNLILEWKHPNKSNGNINSFIIFIRSQGKSIPEERITVSEDSYNLTYFHQMNSSMFFPTTSYRVSIYADNGFKGDSATVNVESPPDIPSLSTEPSIESSNTSITIFANPKKIRGQSDKYRLIVLRDGQTPSVVYPELEKLHLGNLKVILDCNINDLNLNLIIGNSQESKHCQEFNNSILETGKSYNITLILINSYKNQNRTKTYSYSFSTEGEPLPLETDYSLFGLFALLLLIPLIALLYLKRNTFIQIKNNLLPENPSTEILEIQDNQIPLSQVERNVTIHKKVTKTPSKTNDTQIYSKPIKITNFEEYVKESLQNGELERQHSLFPRGATKPCKCGSLPENKSKNRYKNLIAYDHTRVILRKISNIPHSDYINANYIDSYKIQKAYIATQGPKASTLEDFWRMIWQENVRHIAMLANIYEGGKKKVEKYWPDINETLEYNEIKIQHISHNVFADFDHRIFLVTYKEETRKIEQLHFSSWPDHGVPLYSQSLVPFLQKILQIPLNTNSPIVVHCSAGVGRTGTILLCDICLRMAAREGVIDVLKNLQFLREQRANMVDNIEQYKLAHLVILECLVGLHTNILCKDLNDNINRIIDKDNLLMQMRYLMDTQWQDQAMKTVAETGEEILIIKEKNRFQNIIPEIQGRVFITRFPPNDETSSYINAVRVDGFRAPNRFIVTQQPLPNTLGDFWRLINEHTTSNYSLIISLNEINSKDKTSCQFWPTSLQFKPVPYITIKHVNTVTMESYDVFNLHLYAESRKDFLQVQIISMKGWLSKYNCPKSIEDFLTFWEQTNSAGRGTNPIFITCYDGVKASGLYVAMSFIIEKMKLEQTCDVCQAVRSIRHNRSQFVEDLEQFEFLYKAAAIYLNGFQFYANFM